MDAEKPGAKGLSGMVRLREIRDRFREELRGQYPEPEIDQIFALLTAHYFGYPRYLLAMEPAKELGPGEAGQLLEALGELKANQPVQYITGQAHFMGMDLRVAPGVLIPRPETGELVAWILESHSPGKEAVCILDVGTGSGCIALALKRHLPGAEVHALDLSPEALAVARANAERQGLELAFHLGDIRDPGPHWPPFDLVVSNPPYIPLGEKEQIRPHVREAEPHLALFVPDEDPLVMYRYLAAFAASRLRPGGWLYLEVHEHYAGQVADLLRGFGFADILPKKDIFGKDRFVRGRWPGTASP